MAKTAAATPAKTKTKSKTRRPPRIGEAPIFRNTMITVVLILVALVIIAPLAVIGYEAFSRGVAYFGKTIANSDTRHAILMTGLTALIAVPVNTAFGVAAAWAITKFDFPGRRLASDRHARSHSPCRRSLPASPISSVYGLQGLFGDALQSADVKILFAAAWHRACQHVRHRALRRPRAHSFDAGAGPRPGGSRHLARGQRLADILLRHPAQYQMGAALRRHPVQLAGHG